MKGITILGMVFLPGTFVSVSHTLSTILLRPLFLATDCWVGRSGNLQHEFLWPLRQPGEWIRDMDSVEPVLDLLGDRNTSDCADTDNVVCLGPPAGYEKVAVVPYCLTR